MAYRSDTDALEARLDVLTKDLAERTQERDEVARMLAEARDRDAAQRWLDERPRRRRRRIVIAAVASTMLALGGVVSFFVVRHDSQHERDEKVLRDLEQFADDTCKCTDSKCATAVNERMQKWAEQMAKDYQPDRKPSEEVIKRVTVIAERLTKCMTKAMTTNEQQASPPIE
jgi:hypothetical protein